MINDRMKSTDAWVFLLPPGWARFPVGAGRGRELDAAIDEVVARAFPADLPRGSTEPHRQMTRDRLRAALRKGGDEGASVVYLPVQSVDGVYIPASIVEVEFDSDPGVDPLTVVLSVLAAGYDESDVLEIDGKAACRVTSSLQDVPGENGMPTVSSRQVVYAVSRDHDEGSWLALSFTVVFNSPDSERLADALVLFFDAVMTTFRWAGDGGPEDPTDQSVSVPGSTRRP